MTTQLSPSRPFSMSLWLQRLLRAMLGLLLALMLLLLGAWVGLPYWLEHRGVALASEQLGRTVSLESAHFRPWRLALELRGLRIAGPREGGPDLLALRRIEATLSLRSLRHFAPVLASLQIEAPQLRLAYLGQGRTDLDDILQRLAQRPRPVNKEPNEPVALALYNIELSDGQLWLEDRPAGMQHRLEALRLGVPFISTLGVHDEVHVTPLLSGRLNGVDFHSGGQAQPFADKRNARLNVQVQALDLMAYQRYWPRELPVRLSHGRLDLALQLDFSQAPNQAPQIKLGGVLKLHELGLQQGSPNAKRDRTWQDWISLETLELGLADVQPLHRTARFDHLLLRAPRLTLQRDGRGRLLLPQLNADLAEDGPAPAKASARAPTPPVAGTSPAQPWRLSLKKLQLDQGELGWRDAATRPAAALTLDQLSLQGRDLVWPLAGEATSAGRVDMQARLSPAASAARSAVGQKSTPAPSAQITGQASLSKAGLELDWQLRQLALAWFNPYLNSITPLQISGELALAGKVRADAQGGSLQLGLRDLNLQGLQARSGRDQPLSVQALTLDELTLQWPERRIRVGQVALKVPRLQLAHSREGQGSWERWLNTPAASSMPAASRGRAVAGPAWQLQMAELQMQGGQLQLLDLAAHVLDDETARPIGVQEVQLRVRGVDWDGRQLRKPLAVQLGLSLRRPDNARAEGTRRPPGRLQWEGQVAQSPLRATGKLRAERLPLHWADPYLDPTLGLHLQRLEGDVRGEMEVRQEASGLRLRVALPQLLLSELRLRQARLQQGQRRSAEDLLSWQALKLDGLQLLLAPGGAPSLSIQHAGLEDFYARMIINEQGRLNLRDLRQTEAGQAVSAAPAATSASGPVASAGAPAGGPLKLALGGLSLKGGQVDFNDRFIKPSYSARLSALTGSLGAFSAASPAMAPLQLQGRVAGTGLLEVSGQLNPAAVPLALDIQASASDIELAPLSPYAGKYAGFAIERGKLSTRVRYAIDPEGRLQADNQIVLNQLEFGEPIASPDATKLPVRLAVALLKDRQGVIDVNLPVSGSINDPEFSVGGVVLKLILNLLGKALTAPFSLLSGGGGAELSQLNFAPGTTQLDAAAPERLDRIAQTLTDKPVLQLSITGWVDPAGERRSAQAARLEEALQAEFKREQRRAGQAVGATAQLDAIQRQRLLKAVYDATKLPNKPRNLLGLAKDIPAEEMSVLLMDSYGVSDEQQRELALQRAVVVRDALIERGVANARLFLASPKLHTSQDAASEPAKAWQPHVDLSLSAR